MASEKNITMRQYNGVDYDTLYPKTKVEQVEGAYTQQQILANSTKTLYGLDATAVPDDVLALIKPMIDNNYAELSSLANSKAKIVTGSYAGTNSVANSITFPALPKFVYITGPSGNWKNAFITVVNGTASYTFESENSSYSYTPKISGTKISWVANDNPFYAMNYTGNYQWIAIY